MSHDFSGFRSGQHDLSKKGHKLTLHVAVTAGPVQHVIMGNLNGRLDYVVEGDCLHELGVIIDEAKSGELGLSPAAWKLLVQGKNLHLMKANDMRTLPGVVVLQRDGLRRACDVLFPNLIEKSASERVPTIMQQGSDEIFFGNAKRYFTPPPMPQLDQEDAGLKKLLERFINQSLLHKIKQSDILGREAVENTIQNEFRQLSIVFVKLKFNFDAIKAQMVTHLFLKAISAQGGVFQQFSVDDKGQTMLAIFGLPPYTHENDARRALKAGAEFIDLASPYHFGDIHVSVATGDIMFATIGSEYRSEASFLGDAVNVAARIMGLCLDRNLVVCDEKTKLSVDGLDFKDLGEHKVKGKVESLRLFGVNILSFSTEKREGSNVSEVVGYAEERECLVKMFTEWCQSGRQGLAMVEGASGMGKSKIMESFMRIVQDAGVKTCLTQGSEVDQWTPYFGMRSLVYQIYMSRAQELKLDPASAENQLSTAPSSNSVYETVTTRSLTLQPRASTIDNPNRTVSTEAIEFMRSFKEDPILTPLLNGVLPPKIRIPENETTRSMDGKTRKALLISLIVRIIASFTSTHRIVVLFDDSQWLDPVSLEVLLNIVNTASKSFFVFFTRPMTELSNESLLQIQKHEKTQYRYIKGFSIADLERLIISRFEQDEVKSVCERFLQAIFDRAGGSPLASGMMLEALKIKCPEGLLISNSTLRFDSRLEGLDEVLSGSLSASITIQFDRINVLLQEFLKKASVLGQYFQISQVLELMKSGNSVEDVLDWISQYDQFQFLKLLSLPAGADIKHIECYFRHITIMNTIYDSLPFHDRQNLHLLAGKQFESAMECGDKNENLLPIVAFHYYRSGDIPKTILYLEKLGMLHLKKFLFRECISTTQKLIQFCDERDIKSSDLDANLKKDFLDPLRRSQWFAMLAVSYSQVKDFANGLWYCSRSLEIVASGWPTEKKKVLKLARRAVLVQIRLFIQTNGGLKPCKLHPVLDSPRRLAIFSMTSRALLLVALYSPNTISPEQRLLILLWNLNASIKTAKSDPVAWAALCFMIGVGFAWRLPSVSRIYLNLGIKIEKMIKINIVNASYGLYLFEATEAINRILGGMFYQCVGYCLQGKFSAVTDLHSSLGNRISTAALTDSVWTTLFQASVVRTALFQKDFELAESLLSQIQKVMLDKKPGYLTSSYSLEEIQSIHKIVTFIAARTRYLKTKMHMQFVGLIGSYYEAASFLYQEGGRGKAVSVLNRILKNTKYSKLLHEEFRLLLALTYSFIGLYSTSEQERRAMSSSGIEMLAGFEATAIVEWVKEYQP
ncbi:hypothetical protein HDU97_006573 [Phlyctochytrium planicorne]|nr:hypothetical protein HDU97_006573 [Phlyctochytrium planicorne]